MTIIEKLTQIYGDKVNQYASDLDCYESYVDLPKGHMSAVKVHYEDSKKKKLGRILTDIPALMSEEGICYVTFEDAQVIEHFKVLCDWNAPEVTEKKVTDFDTLYVDYYCGIEDTIGSAGNGMTDKIEFENIYQVGDAYYGDVVHYVGNNRGCLYNIPLNADTRFQKVNADTLDIINYFKQSLRYHAIDLKKESDYNIEYDALKKHMKMES